MGGFDLNPAEVHTKLARADAFDQIAADIQVPPVICRK